MLRTFIAATLVTLSLAAPARAGVVEIKMLNKGEDGTIMVFDPAYVRLEPGDTLRFLATDKGHNAESVKGMHPSGAETFKGKINQEIEVTFEREGWYGILCKPHFAMGMVMVVEVGDADVPEDFLAGRIPPRAMARFEDAIARAQ
ncbi:MAG: pseudoazurin [Rhodospirillales bacterium]